MEKRFNKSKREYEEELIQLLEEHTTFKAENYSPEATHTTIMEKSLKQLIADIWESVIPISCPHCQAKNPGFRKDGFTKLFRKPLSEKLKNSIKQQDRIRKGSSARSANNEDFEVTTADEVSTRKHSHTTHSEKSQDYEDIYEDEEEDEELPTNQQIISPIEVKDFIEKLWRKEKQLLDLMYGRYYPVIEGEPYVSDSLGAKMFFIQKLIVPPNRFRPESQGGLGGGAGSGDKSYLHAHSAMLVKILNLNLALKDAFLEASRNESQQHSQSGRTPQTETMQKWIQLQDAINTFMDSSMAQKTADRE